MITELYCFELQFTLTELSVLGFPEDTLKNELRDMLNCTHYYKKLAFQDFLNKKGCTIIQLKEQLGMKQNQLELLYQHQGVMAELMDLGVKNEGNYYLAMYDYIKAIKLNPNNDCIYNNMGLIHYDQGSLQAAIEKYNDAIHLNSGIAIYYANRGAAYQAQQDYDHAKKDYQQARQLNPGAAFV